MTKRLYREIRAYFTKVNWLLLLFLVLVLNVKLVIKIAALVIITIYRYRSVTWKNIRRQHLLYFYFGIVAIGLLNLIFNFGSVAPNYSIVFLFGVGLWMAAAAASFHLFEIIQNEKKEILHNTFTSFFVLHFSVVLLNLLRIMIECRSINPYTYKGLNQKYYLSTGDHLPGITWDSPVATALISAFALLYFLQRRQFALSLIAALCLSLIGSNLTNIFLAIVLAFVFIFRSDRIQKSFIVMQISILIIFLVRVSPRDNEYLGRVVYGIVSKTYDLPQKNESIEFIKTQPDSLLDPTDLNRKAAQLSIDSVNAIRARSMASRFSVEPQLVIKKDTAIVDKGFYQFKAQPSIEDRIRRYTAFMHEHYTTLQTDSLKAYYDWNKPGKWIAYLELYHFLKAYPGKILMGAGIGNFASRTAFKATTLGMAGSYPEKYRYIHPSFLNNHLYLYLYYHSQDQMKHAAANTPDSAYSQLLGEYGMLGMLCFLVLYVGYFIRRLRFMSYGLPLLLLLMMALSVEYWFEQLSVVILFEALLFLDIKSNVVKAEIEK